MQEITFLSHGVTCAAWHLSATNDELATDAGRPAVVMAHGFGGTRDSGLLNYAEGFAEAGIDAFVFDYRGFGASQGTPRQHVSFLRQRQDYHAALAAARRLPGVDPARVALWGTSYAGGHVIAVAAQDRQVAAVVALTPAVDGLALLLRLGRTSGPASLVRATAHGLRDLARAVTRRAPHHMPIVGRPGASAIISTPGAYTGYTAVAGPTWRNEVCARAALEVAMNRPTTFAQRVPCPTLVHAGTNDLVAPIRATRRTVKKLHPLAELIEYPVDHFDVYQGEWQRKILADQTAFLTSKLGRARG
ncbi:alpha-beta hydrolase superfamily lysophospholipase [Mycobacterium frederiksbergense]|uniref:Alpha-beta hydrolase superfamily lysophospholipase n=1 Tax=Mycolicibacterium frederiksbergense TaxID=117567 RepID=A0ABT6KTW5_9MYCO|nr:alpha/beta fold hydrolase [Mycolicibacterium frederiksbergense]MDH6194158.1 alpha-beta hydrolase superfamily lysophospholipase [Mycolicibacterium frederiksbergense]